MPFKIPERLSKEDALKMINEVDNFLFDCDGVIWNWPQAIPGSVEFLNTLKSLGKRCFFITNNSTKTRESVTLMLNKIGVQNVTEDDIVCTAWILAGYLKSIDFKDKAYVVGNQSMATELTKLGIKHVGVGSTATDIPDPANFDYVNKIELDPDVKCVVVGFDHYFSYPKMVTATSYAYGRDCLFIATNDDAQLPTGNGKQVVIPGTGTFVNALKTSIGREPIILGKPHRTMWEVLSKLHGLDANRTCMIGDRLETDIAFAANCSLAFSLAVLSGVTNEPEILKYAQLLEEKKFNHEQAKNVPDYYTACLGDFERFINAD